MSVTIKSQTYINQPEPKNNENILIRNIVEIRDIILNHLETPISSMEVDYIKKTFIESNTYLDEDNLIEFGKQNGYVYLREILLNWNKVNMKNFGYCSIDRHYIKEAGISISVVFFWELDDYTLMKFFSHDEKIYDVIIPYLISSEIWYGLFYYEQLKSWRYSKPAINYFLKANCPRLRIEIEEFQKAHKNDFSYNLEIESSSLMFGGDFKDLKEKLSNLSDYISSIESFNLGFKTGRRLTLIIDISGSLVSGRRNAEVIKKIIEEVHKLIHSYEHFNFALRESGATIFTGLISSLNSARLLV